MKPYGPLMVEHRLIERMVSVLKKRKKIDDAFIRKTVDFFRIYADKRHHGKEEDILFKRLEKKKMPSRLKRTMKRLIGEHRKGRQIIGDLEGGKRDPRICVQDLIRLYPQHIDTEDKKFFIPCMEYLDEKEQEEMIKRYREVDRKIPEDRYRQTVERLESEE